MRKPYSDYLIAAIGVPLLGFAFLLNWIFREAWVKGNMLTLENGKRVENGSWAWWWYRLMLDYRVAKVCPDCKAIIDSSHTTDLCVCAFLDDMKGMQ